MADSSSTKKKKGGSGQFKGPVLFVNHGIGDLESAPHRHEVFTHVQNNYRRWRRREDARAIRAGVSLPTSFGPDRESHLRRPSSDTSSSSSSGSEADPHIREALRRAELEEAHRQSLSPLKLIRQGNSDPFSAQELKIDPAANELIGFWRDYIIPGVYHISRRKALSHASAQRDFNDVIESLADPGGAYSVLARSAFIASHTNPEMRKTALTYVDKSVKELMKKTSKTSDLQNQQVYWQVMNLWAAESIDGNVVGALAHGKILRYLFEQQVRAGKIDFKHLLYAVFTDSQMSAIFIIPPVFSPEWLSQILVPMFKMAAGVAAAVYPPLPNDVARNDPSIDDPELQEILSRRREGLQYWIFSAKSQTESPQSQLLFAWMAFRATISQGKTVKYYLQKKHALKAPNLTEAMKDRTYAHTYLALATLYLTRTWSFNQSVLNVPIFNANPNILAKLREILEESDRLPGGETFHVYNNARLWAFYVGAYGEHMNAMAGRTVEGTASGASKAGGPGGTAGRAEGGVGTTGGTTGTTSDPFKGWFNARLAEQAYITDIKTWDQAKEVFRGFLLNQILPPLGETWYEKTVAQYVDPDVLEGKDSAGGGGSERV